MNEELVATKETTMYALGLYVVFKVFVPVSLGISSQCCQGVVRGK